MPHRRIAALLLCLSLCACTDDRNELFAACQTAAAEVHPGEGEQIKLRGQFTAACMIENGYQIEVSRPGGSRCPANGPTNITIQCYRRSGIVYDVVRFFEIAVLSRD